MQTSERTLAALPATELAAAASPMLTHDKGEFAMIPEALLPQHTFRRTLYRLMIEGCRVRISDRGLKVLRAMIDNPARPMAGSDLFRSTGVGFSTIYPMLIRFEKAGWLSAKWEDVKPEEAGRPAKRLYQLTGLGQREAQARLSELSIGAVQWAH